MAANARIPENSLFPADALWQEVARAIHAYCLAHHGQPAAWVRVWCSHGFSFSDRLPPPEDLRQQPERWDCGPRPRHLSDWQQVYWPGLGTFRFTAAQARAVKVLWEAMEDGTHWVEQRHLLRAAGSDSHRLSDVFSRSEAWARRMIVGQGSLYRLAELPQAEEE